MRNVDENLHSHLWTETLMLLLRFMFSGASEDELWRHATQHRSASDRETEKCSVAFRYSKWRRTNFLYRVGNSLFVTQLRRVRRWLGKLR